MTRRLRSAPPRGAVLFFTYPPNSETWYVKRVVGVGGDRIGSQSWLTINESELVGVEASGSSHCLPGSVVEEGSVFVLADNVAASSFDSRSFGALPWQGCYRLWFRYGRS